MGERKERKRKIGDGGEKREGDRKKREVKEREMRKRYTLALLERLNLDFLRCAKGEAVAPVYFYGYNFEHC
eukprot:1122416-Amorphochlora_amoeboformis.AAC.1